ncbi:MULTISPECIES: hypothetical protein [Halorussus]|uniref:hypothetical protein n=1 Tax=Halorussus TaxID=1070314 RepID=UPI00209CE3C0|nr:hypothetical protein [Halorussus vallis]USZ75265.1 hypothetical protein NGM07_17760 [Halorussus vallis]
MELTEADGLRNLGVVWLYVCSVFLVVEALQLFGVGGAPLVLCSLAAGVLLAVVVLWGYNRVFLDEA